jgi:hypothetical protein
MMLRSQKTRHCKGRPTTESGTHSTAPFLRNGGGKPNADLTPSSPESSNTAEVGEAILAPFHNPQWEGNPPAPPLSPRGKEIRVVVKCSLFSRPNTCERERERLADGNHAFKNTRCPCCAPVPPAICHAFLGGGYSRLSDTSQPKQGVVAPDLCLPGVGRPGSMLILAF